MGQKDIVCKALESYNDVFADIVNGFIFKGKKVVKENALFELSPESYFKSDGKYYKQDRDVAKLWKENGIRIAFYGIENQTTVDSSMPLRVISYDGMAYKQQLINYSKSKESTFYPVITFVLYIGNKPWKKNKNLLDVLKIRPEFKPFVSDYKINLIDVSDLSEEQIKLFKSDFRSLIDWLKKQKDPEYEVAPRQLNHPDELKQLLYSMSGDERVLSISNSSNNEKGGTITMCEFIDRLEARGEARGEIKGQLKLLVSLIKDGVLTLKQAAKRIGMTETKFKSATKELAIN